MAMSTSWRFTSGRVSGVPGARVKFGKLSAIYTTLHPILFGVTRLGTISSFRTL
jgi:hypothetical protein